MVAIRRSHRCYTPRTLTGAGSLADIVRVPDWHLAGLCNQTDPEAFYPEKGKPAKVAKSICAGCPVQATCGLAGINNREQFGVWGAMTWAQRKKVTAADLAELAARSRDELAALTVRVALTDVLDDAAPPAGALLDDAA